MLPHEPEIVAPVGYNDYNLVSPNVSEVEMNKVVHY